MDEQDYRLERQTALIMWEGFYRCPNNGRIIECLPGDDKVLCRCGKPNPNVPTEYPGVHHRRFLTAVSVDDYMAQRQADRAADAAAKGN